MNIQEIDFKPLFQWINQSIGLNAIFHMGFKDGCRPWIVNGDNLWNDSGIFQSVIKNVKVDFFNFEYNEETGSLWATVNINFESWTQGSNGIQIGTCWFNPEEGWTFESCKERFKKFNS